MFLVNQTAYKIIRESKVYKSLRQSVYKRDKFKCKLCGMRSGGIEMHHIIRFYDELKNIDFTDCKTDHQILVKARLNSTVLNARNCITLCHDCHTKLVTGFEVFWIPLLKHLLLKPKDQSSQFIKQELDLLEIQLPIELTKLRLFKRIKQKL